MEKSDKNPGILFLAPPSASGIDFFIWNNLSTGPILVGDTIHDAKSGKSFTVVKRTWGNGRDVEAKLIIQLVESE